MIECDMNMVGGGEIDGSELNRQRVSARKEAAGYAGAMLVAVERGQGRI
jgi:hypothetical protein